MPEGFRLRASGFGPCWLLVASIGVFADAAQQTVGEQVRFEVASVKPHVDTGSTQAGIEENEGFVRITNLPLQTVIAIAYDVMGTNVEGPAWLERRRFDIAAKPPEGYQRRQLPVVLRNLLADRFRLVARRETRQGRGYALQVIAGGHRLTESAGPRTFLTGRPGLIAGNGRSIAELVPLLSRMTGAPVVDETGLKGAFDVKLEWTPQLAAGGGPEPDVSIFTAVREQLGLRLEPAKADVDVVVVASVEETPTPD
jgi:uncharacterized protein (TIGR03435 family)